MRTDQDPKTSNEGTRTRPARAADLGRLAALEAASFRDPWGEEDLAVWLVPELGASWVIEGTAGVLAYALFLLLPGESEMLRIAVAPELRRRGLARRLLVTCLAELAATGRPICHLEVRAGNRDAVSLYESLSFVAVGRRRDYYSDGEDALVFRRDAGGGGPSGRAPTGG